MQIQVPPLRTRGDDILLLAQHFLQEVARRLGKNVVGISPEAAAKLMDYPWPGNVRELQNSMERAVALTRFDNITVDDLPDRVGNHRSTNLNPDLAEPALMPTLDEVERRYIEKVLRLTGGNKTQAARVVGLDRRTLYRRIDKLDVDTRGAGQGSHPVAGQAVNRATRSGESRHDGFGASASG